MTKRSPDVAQRQRIIIEFVDRPPRRFLLRMTEVSTLGSTAPIGSARATGRCHGVGKRRRQPASHCVKRSWRRAGDRGGSYWPLPTRLAAF
jgi:hypothetical protein